MDRVARRARRPSPSRQSSFLPKHGFPPDLPHRRQRGGFTWTWTGYKRWVGAQEDRAGVRLARREGHRVVLHHQLYEDADWTRVPGYETLEADSKVRALVVGGKKADSASEGQAVEVVVERSPFYGESGGQVGDTGLIVADGLTIEVADTKKPVGNLLVHLGR
jgi:alanyl-tRNA synthetase